MSAPKPAAWCWRCCAPRVHFNTGADGDRVGSTTTIVVITLELLGFSLDCLELARGLAAAGCSTVGILKSYRSDSNKLDFASSRDC